MADALVAGTQVLEPLRQVHTEYSPDNAQAGPRGRAQTDLVGLDQ